MHAPLDHDTPKPRWQPRPALLRLRSIGCLVAIDLLSILTGFGIAIVTRTALFGGTQWRLMLGTLVPLYFLAAVNNRAYHSSNLQGPFRSVRRSLQAMGVAIVATVILGFSLKTSNSLPRLVAMIGFLLSCGFLFVGRFFFAQHFEAIIGGNPFNVVLIRDGDQPVPAGPFSVIVSESQHFDPERHDPVMYDRLAKALQGADRVVIACPAERRAAWAHALKGISVQGEIIVSEFGSLAPLGMGFYGDTPTMVVSICALQRADRAIKRAFDLVAAGGAAFLLSPLLIAVAIAVKLDSHGPILFKQTRIGRDNEMFKVLKFRSMRVEASDGAGHRSAARDDDRITRVGRFIRSTSIDELPQLFNVLKGDMSIVGPRPHALGSRAADKLFWEVDQRYWHRHAAKPGLTGLAQVRGFRGATLVEADLANRLQADLEYLEDWTIWRDIKIIVLTFRVLLHRNAF
jgi:lipopolysaccharide/colanic/teichoic acid biosynthesis glycosyltransferase